MFTTLDIIKDIINDNFVKTHKLTRTFKRYLVKQEELKPVSEQQLKHRQDFYKRKQFKVFNKNNLKVEEKQITSCDEINK